MFRNNRNNQSNQDQGDRVTCELVNRNTATAQVCDLGADLVAMAERLTSASPAELGVAIAQVTCAIKGAESCSDFSRALWSVQSIAQSALTR